MISDWLTWKIRDPDEYDFPVVDLYDTSATDRDQLVDYLAEILVAGLVPPDRLEEIMRKAGLDKVLAVLRARVTDRKLSVLVGDFGEIVVAEMLKDLEGYLVPIAKLRFREKRNWPMRLTDVLGIRHRNGQLIELCLCECKTRTSWKKGCEQVGVAGYQELETGFTQRIPEIVEFVADKLRLVGDFAMADMMDTFLLSDNPESFARHCVLVCFFDHDIWQDTVLANIAKAPVRIGAFSTRVLRVHDLRQLIDSSYARVVEKYNERNPVPPAH